MPNDLAAVTVIGTDRPGIIATIAKGLFEAGCNLEDVSSTILRGHFTMMLIVRVSGGIGVEELERRLAEAGRPMGLLVATRALDETEPRFDPPTHSVSVYGADRPGIVFRVAEALAGIDVNVTDLQSRILGAPADPVYVLLIEAAVPEGLDIETELQGLRRDLGVELSVRPLDSDIL